MSKTTGIKHDDKKVDMTLFSWIWLVGVGRVLTKGKFKYAAHNWRGGLLICRLLAAVIRHILLFMAGQDTDSDPDCEDCKRGDCKKHTNEHHLYCASCGLMFACELLVTRPDLDDRYKYDIEQIKLVLKMLEM